MYQVSGFFYQVSDSCIKYRFLVSSIRIHVSYVSGFMYFDQSLKFKYQESCIKYQAIHCSFVQNTRAPKNKVRKIVLLCVWKNYFICLKILFLQKFSEGGIPSRKFYSERVLLLLTHVCPNYTVSLHSITT